MNGLPFLCKVEVQTVSEVVKLPGEAIRCSYEFELILLAKMPNRDVTVQLEKKVSKGEMAGPVSWVCEMIRFEEQILIEKYRVRPIDD